MASICCLWLLTAPMQAEEQEWIVLSSKMDVWRKPSSDWVSASKVELDPKNPRRFTWQEGAGILVNGPRGRTRNLVTRENYTDLEVYVEFMVPKRSNSGIKLMGLYEIQILDSHGKKKPSGSDCGGIYPRAEHKPRYHHIDKGTPPKINASKPAGEWQSFHIIFRAPRFDEKGKKIANAKFIKVVHNGKVIHENVDVKYPTGAAWRRAKERAKGPLLLQADHGPVAFRTIKIRKIDSKDVNKGMD